MPCERVCSAMWRGAPGLSDPVRPRKQRSHVVRLTVARLSEAGFFGVFFLLTHLGLRTVLTKAWIFLRRKA